MLDFCEALGRMLSDDSWRVQLFALRTQTTPDDCHIVFPAASYASVRALLHGALTNHSYSLATDGEILRLAAVAASRANVDGLAHNLATRTMQFPNGTASFYTALGALTIDQVLRGVFLTSPGPIAEITGLTVPEVARLSAILSDATYIRDSDRLCFEFWSEGCFVRIRYYPGYAHPKPRSATSVTPPAATFKG